MEKKLQQPETYDTMFEAGGYAGVFDLPYKRSPYYPLFCTVAKTLEQHKVKRVLEVGCGTGSMAQLLLDRLPIDYCGFDFSPIAVAKAKSRTDRAQTFFVADATAASTYQGLDYEAIICTEVLEHIEDDLLAMRHWAPGTFCVCSVPNYDADTHVRYFKNAAEVASRYGEVLDIERIELKRKPMLNDLTTANWLQAVIWNRYRPERLRWLFGFSDFDQDGGWFVFSGRRRAL